MEELIQWLINNGCSYIRKASTHTGFYLYKNEMFTASFYNIDKGVWVRVTKTPAGSGGWVYTDDTERIKNIFKGLFGFD